MLSLHQLRTLIVVAETGSVQRAAEALVVSQPAVSAALAALQRAIGAPVVERAGRGIRLSAAGERLVGYGRRIVALVDEALAEAAVEPAAGRVRLAAVTSAAEGLVPRLLRGFRDAAPAMRVEVEIANKAAVWDRLAHGEADVVLAGRPPHGGPFRTLATRANELIVVAPAEAAPPDVATATWLLREPGSGTREAAHALIGDLEIAPPAVTIGSNGAIRACVRAGLGVSLIARDAVADDLAAGTLVEVPTERTPLQRAWHLVVGAGTEPSAATARFVAFATAAGGFRAADASRADSGALRTGKRQTPSRGVR